MQGSRGNYIIQYTSESDTPDGNTTFSGCTIAGSFGALSGSPYSDTVNAGSFVVQSVFPPAGQSTSINPSPITVTANTPFTLPVVSTTGFANATPANPGYTLLYYQGGALAVVSYTGISPDPNGGSNLTGCTTQTAGTIGAFGTDSPGPSANVQWTSAAPVNFSFTNNSAQDPVYIAIAGQQIDTQTNAATYGYLAPQLKDGAPDFTKPWQFETFGSKTSVPTYTLFSDASLAGAAQSVLIPNNPYARLDSFRIIFSVGAPPTIPIVSGKPSFPAAGNPSDPNNKINYDFVEFTERSSPNDGILFINTTQVDQVGLPFTMQTTPRDAVKHKGVGITVSRPTLFTDFSTYIKRQFSSNTNADARAAAMAFQSLSTSYRLLNPSDAISNPPSSDASLFNTYFDAALTSFFNNYLTVGQTFRLQRDGYYFVGQTEKNFSPPAYSSQANNTGTDLLIAANGGSPTPLTFAVGEQVTGPGITGTATITKISVDPATHVTDLAYTPSGSSGSGKYTFTVPGTFTVLALQQTDSDWNVISGGQTYQIYAPYFSNGSAYPANFPQSTPLAAAPPWIAPASAGEMVFGNLGAFADGAAQAADGQISGTGVTGQILLDIENTIVSAFNRGVANSVAPGNDVTSAWDNNATYYPLPNTTGSNWSNFYAGFLHNDGVSITAPGSNVGLAYGFAYDDQGGNDPTLTSFATKVSITLNALLTPPRAAANFRFAAGNQIGWSDRSSGNELERRHPDDELHRCRFRALEARRRDGRTAPHHQEQRTRQAPNLIEVTHPSSAGHVSGTGAGPARHRFGRGLEVVQNQVIRRGISFGLDRGAFGFPTRSPTSKMATRWFSPR